MSNSTQPTNDNATQNRSLFDRMRGAVHGDDDLAGTSVIAQDCIEELYYGLTLAEHQERCGDVLLELARAADEVQQVPRNGNPDGDETPSGPVEN